MSSNLISSNTDYKYIKQSEWLQQNILTQNIIMNDTTTNSLIGSRGSCVIITIIMAHMIHLYDGYSIKDLILLFNKMCFLLAVFLTWTTVKILKISQKSAHF